jgi:S1-C subfamily serine protease
MAKQPCHHCRTGMRYSNLSEQDKEIAQSNYGVVINLVIEGKIAYKSNLMRNDVVVSVNDEPIYDGSEFNAMLRRCIEEKKVAKLGVIRKGEPKTIIFKF